MSKFTLTFFTDEADSSLKHPIDRVNRTLIEFINQKSKDAGYDSCKDLAKDFGYKNPDKVLRHLEGFNKTGELNREYMKKLLELLKIDPAEIERIKNEHTERLNEPLNLFIKEFDALYSRRKIILNTPRYRNMVVYGIDVNTAWVSRNRPFTLGELYYHWDHKEFIEKKYFRKLFIYNLEGSALSGANTFTGYCPATKKIYRGSLKSFHEHFNAYITYVPDFPYEYSDCTMQELVESLLGQTG